MENEKFGFELDTVKPMSPDQIKELMEKMAARFEYKKMNKDDITAGLKKVHSLQIVYLLNNILLQSELLRIIPRALINRKWVDRLID